MQKKLAILHYLPIEGYPPVVNLLRVAASKKNMHTLCISTQGNFNFKTQISGTSILRLGNSGSKSKMGRYLLLLSYLHFNLIGIFKLIKYRPHTIIYYETISSFPAIIYKKVFPNTKLYIHYHEYTSPLEYKIGMKSVNWFHKLEQKIYNKASWLSHTNEFRMNLFLEDNQYINKEITHIMPNYPPHKWVIKKKETPEIKLPLKLVYVGSFASFDTMYIKEIIEWIKNKQDIFTLDIYSFNVPNNIKEYCSIPNVYFKGPIEYEMLPEVLINYNVGLIIYRATIQNVKFCASNKLFEYLACGLDVWFSTEMVGTHPYVQEQYFPKVIAVDFKRLSDFNWQSATNHDGLLYNQCHYYAENAFEKIFNSIDNTKMN